MPLDYSSPSARKYSGALPMRPLGGGLGHHADRSGLYTANSCTSAQMIGCSSCVYATGYIENRAQTGSTTKPTSVAQRCRVIQLRALYSKLHGFGSSNTAGGHETQ